MSTPRQLLARLRHLMARGPAPLGEIARLVADELPAAVCSIYATRPGDVLELAATCGLRPEAVGRTRLRVGEGIVGMAAATAHPMNLADAQNHPDFAYRPETGEEVYASLLAVPVRRAGRTLGVLAVQDRTPRRYESDEVEALETVAMLLVEPLAAVGAADTREEGRGATQSRRFSGVVLVPGLTIGPAVLAAAHTPRRLLADDPAAEQERLLRAMETVRRGIDALITDRLPADAKSGPEAREILEAYRLVAADPGWLRRVGEAIAGGLAAEAAVHRVMEELRDHMRHLADPNLRERMADLEDMAGRLLAALGGDGPPEPVPEGAILIARRLGPAQLLHWYDRGIGGMVVEEASPGSHATILARALAIPVIGGTRGLLEEAETGDEVILDADETQRGGSSFGQVILHPESDILAGYQHALEARRERQAGWAALRHRPAATRDGTPMTLMLNVGLPLELAQLAATGAAGIGLFRTEIAMLARGAVADMAEQTAVYARVLDEAAGRPVLFRTLDLGGDKLLPGSPLPEEQNPAMGWRSLRIGLDRPVLLRRQLRALLLAAAGRELSVMFPMVATVAEFCAARALLTAEAQRVRPQPQRLRIGSMLEVPALLWQLPALLKVADFLSVGTNDLLQFVFAADRGSSLLAERYDLLAPAMLTLLADLATQARAAGVPLSVCGEAASRPLEAITLAALGVTTLSMPASSILPVKAALAATDLPALRALLKALRGTDASEASLREPIAAWAQEHALPV
jgi:phosphotransferase system enzyme I (PtsP)